MNANKEPKMRTWLKLVVCFVFAFPAALPAQWAALYEPTGVPSALPAPDGGYLISGGGVLFKIAASGQIQWGKSFEGYLSQTWLTQDGGCLVALDPESGDMVMVFSLAPTGGLQWQKKYTAPGEDIDYFCPTSDDGLLMAGSVANADIVIRKLSSLGEIEWQESIGTDRAETASGLAATADGGCIVIGSSGLADGSSESVDLWILKLTLTGDVQWQERIGGPAEDRGESVRQTIDGGYLVTGRSSSFGPEGQSQLWLMKLSPTGAIERQSTLANSYGGGSWLSIRPTDDGRYLAMTMPAYFAYPVHLKILALTPDGGVSEMKTLALGALTHFFGGDLEPTPDGGCLFTVIASDGEMVAFEDAFVMKLGASGEIEWQKIYGSRNSRDELSSICRASNGGYLLVGSSDSWSGRENSTWIMNIATDGSVNPYCYFIKEAGAESVEDPYAVSEIQAALEATMTIPVIFEAAVETADVITGSKPGTRIPLGNPTCTLTLLPTESTQGTLSPSPGTYVYDAGTVVTLSAHPKPTYYLFYWWGNIYVRGGNSVSVVMDGDKRIGASFEWTGETIDPSGSYCFIASAAYGSPSHPHVRLLRAFRDRFLARSRLGRSLVDFYYRQSPPLARLIGKHPTLRLASRVLLFPVVAASYVLLGFGPGQGGILLFLILGLPWVLISRRVRGRRCRRRRAGLD